MCIAILSIVFGTLYQTFDTFKRAYTTENVVAGVQQKTRNGVEFMVHDIRLAGLDPLGLADAGFLDARSTSLQFTSDSNFDGDVDDPFENITYGLNGDLLEQENHLGSETLLDRVTVLTFSFLDQDENELIDDTLVPPQVPAAQLNDIKTVVITLSTQRSAGRDDPVSRTCSPRVYGGVVYFTTYTPPATGGGDPGDPCAVSTVRGVARLYAVNYKTGASVHNFSSIVETNGESEVVDLGKHDRVVALGTAIPSAPVIAILEGGARLFVGVEGGIVSMPTIETPDMHRYFWHQHF
jgi:hypothetical protein